MYGFSLLKIHQNNEYRDIGHRQRTGTSASPHTVSDGIPKRSKLRDKTAPGRSTISGGDTWSRGTSWPREECSPTRTKLTRRTRRAQPAPPADGASNHTQSPPGIVAALAPRASTCAAPRRPINDAQSSPRTHNLVPQKAPHLHSARSASTPALSVCSLRLRAPWRLWGGAWRRRCWRSASFWPWWARPWRGGRLTATSTVASE